MSDIDSIKNLELISESLSTLGIKHAFVGGATVAVYLTSAGMSETRPTDDIDCVIDPPTLPSYYILEETLRNAGFQNEPKGPRCRWNYKGIVVDIMPANEKISGMPSKWFSEGLQFSANQKLPSGKEVPVFSVVYLLATKFEAYKDRGGKDLRFSTDIEDILTLLDGYPDVFKEIQNSNNAIKIFLVNQFKSLAANESFEDAVYGYMSGLEKEVKAKLVIEKIESFING